MNKYFIQSLTRRAIEDKDFMPAQDEQGNIAVWENLTVLIKQSASALTILEFVDGDVLSEEEIKRRLDENRSRLVQMNSTAASYIVEVFIFSREPEEDKLKALTEGQFQEPAPSIKKHLVSMAVRMDIRTVEKYFEFMPVEAEIASIVRKQLETAETWEDQQQSIEEVVRQKKEEYRLEMKAKYPIFTFMLIGINILMWALVHLYAYKTGVDYDDALDIFGAKDNMLIIMGEVWRFITPIFLHGGVVHLLLNSVSLYMVGVTAERVYGNLKFLLIYLIAGIFGSVCSFAFSPAHSVGASGAIFGIFGTMLYLGLEKPVLFRNYFGGSIISTIIINVIYGYSTPGIDNYGHIGGLIGGFLAAGAVRKAGRKRWYLNRYLFIAAIVVLLGIALPYGFTNIQNQSLIRLDEMGKLMNKGELSEAERIGEEVLAKKPRGKSVNTIVLWNLVQTEGNMGKLDEAFAHARELQQIDPENGHYLLGWLYYNTRQYEQAREELLKAKAQGATYSDIDKMLQNLDQMQ